MPTRSYQATLEIKLQGTAVQHNRIALDDLLFFGFWLQTGVKRIAQVLQGQAQSAQRGRKGAKIEASCALQIKGIKRGSLRILCDLPLRTQEIQTEIFETFDLGEEAVECLVQGIESLGQDGESFPRGYDRGVLSALKKQGELFNRGINEISFTFKRQQKQRIASSYTPKIYAKVTAQMGQPVEARRTLEGRLLMGDFKETGFRCRIHPAIGPSIGCSFDERDKYAVLSALTHHARLTGEARESAGKIREFKIERIEVLDRDAAFFGPPKDWASLAEQQEVEAIIDFDRVASKLWPEREGVDEFIDSIRAARARDLEEDPA
ncbi:MAG: hypothetical protein Q8Q12_21205 [bacterium]|nr:hypothetical protein [bacterium]